MKSSGHPLSSDLYWAAEPTRLNSPAHASKDSSPSDDSWARRSRIRRSTWGCSRASVGSADKHPTGPERFFYDTGSYTGVHAKGGPLTLDEKGFSRSLRSGHHKGSTFTKAGGHILSEDAKGIHFLEPGRDASNFSFSLRPGQHKGKSSMLTAGHPMDKVEPKHIDSYIGGDAERLRAQKRRHTAGANRRLEGPERFFYDRSTYTGAHANGGPHTIDREGFSHSLRPSHNSGRTCISVGGH